MFSSFLSGTQTPVLGFAPLNPTVMTLAAKKDNKGTWKLYNLIDEQEFPASLSN